MLAAAPAAAADVRTYRLAVGSETGLRGSAPVRRCIEFIVRRRVVGIHDEVHIHGFGPQLQAVHTGDDFWRVQPFHSQLLSSALGPHPRRSERFGPRDARASRCQTVWTPAARRIARL